MFETDLRFCIVLPLIQCPMGVSALSSFPVNTHAILLYFFIIRQAFLYNIVVCMPLKCCDD